MNNESETPFDSIEGAQEYLRMLADTVMEARQAIEADISAQRDPHKRRLHALQIVFYKLQMLEQHMKSSRRILNDLRSLRRLLFEERRPSQMLPGDMTEAEVPEPGQYW